MSAEQTPPVVFKKWYEEDTAGFLSSALGQLVNARDTEACKDSPAFNAAAYSLIYGATENVRRALELLRQEEHQP